MKRPARQGDQSVSEDSVPGVQGGGYELAPSEVELLAGALVRLGQRVRSGEVSDAEARAVVEAGRVLDLDLAAAAGWSPSLVLAALLTRPEGATAVAALLAQHDAGSGASDGA